MTRFIFLIFFLTFSSTLISQNGNQEIKIENQQPFLIGQIDLTALSSNSYQNWYDSNYSSYQVDSTMITSIKNELAIHKILIFMGTWCGDSKREVPRFIKILEAADFPMDNLKIVAVDKRKDQYKKSPNGEEWGLRIERVPTFIFYKGGKETYRIIENPVTTLEEDIKAIVTTSEYTPNYSQSLHMD